MPLALAPFYAILDPEQTKGRSPERVLRQLLDGGVKILQLRAKTMPPRDFWRLATGSARANPRRRLSVDHQ